MKYSLLEHYYAVRSELEIRVITDLGDKLYKAVRDGVDMVCREFESYDE